MNHSPSNFLIFVTREKLYRVDLTQPPNSGRGVEEFSRNPGEELPAAISRLAEGMGRRKSVTLFLEEAWCQPLAIPTSQINGPEDEDLALILPLEAETFSGFPPDRVLTAWSAPLEIQGSYQFTLLQVEVELVEKIDAALRKRGITLTGISHSRFLQGDEMAGIPLSPEILPELLERYREGFGELPLILPKPPPPSPNRFYWLSLILALLGGVLCWQINAAWKNRAGRLAAEESELSGLKSRYDALTREAKKIRSETAATLKAHGESVALREKLHRARTVLPEMIRTLSRSCPETLMIREIRSESPFTLRISGLCASTRDADTFFIQCGEALRPLGWKVVPDEIAAAFHLGSGELSRFSCLFEPPFVRKIRPVDEEEEF